MPAVPAAAEPGAAEASVPADVCLAPPVVESGPGTWSPTQEWEHPTGIPQMTAMKGRQTQ